MILTEVSAPPVAALPVRAFAEHLRLGRGFADDGSLDAALELYLRAAIAAIEARIGQALIARDFVWSIARWREESCQPLPIGPVRSVSRVTLIDAEGASMDLDPATWSVVRDSQRPRLVGRFGRSLPRIPRSGRAEVRFSAGFSETWDGAPADLRQAAFLLAGHFFENRSEGDAAPGTMPFGVLVLLEAYRALRIGGGAIVSRRVRLSRLLTLEERVAAPDGSGGSAVSWRALGAIWADMTARAAREDFVAGRPLPRVTYRILVRAAPMGAPSRPAAEQRLREGARVFDILTVTEHDPEGRYLEIFAEEGAAA